jgi:MYXO-CTERM domain-containing protein
MKSKRHTVGAQGFARPLSVLTLLIGPLVAASSCSGSGGSSGEPLGQESFAQIACGGQASGGTFGRGGISSGGSIIIKGGTGGTGTCPSDDCTLFICKEGRCVVDTMKTEGETCVDSFGGDRGRCAGVDWDGDNRPDFTQCCSAGCLDRNLLCVAYAQQSDAQCGRYGSDCTGCSECKTCSATGTCVAAPSGTDCTGGECLGGSCCTGCISGTTCYVGAPANCGSNGGACVNCDDGKSCTVDKCTNGTCEHTDVTGACDDGDQCTVNDTCSGSTCSGAERNCDDGNPCTDDACDPQDGCTHDPTPGSCNDGNACTTNDMCNASGNCAGTAIVCNDGNQCTDDSCNPMGGCVYTSKDEGETCSDGADCSTGDRCHDDDNNPDTPRVCEPTGGPNCEDGNPCTSDAADCTTLTCPHTPENDGDPCSTGTQCEVAQTCMAGVCGGGTPLACNDDNDCTSDSCDDTQGCLHTPSNDGESCVTPDHCFTDKVCDDGECVGEPVVCTTDNECLEADECEPSDGRCSFTSKDNGTMCGTTGMCRSGACEGDGVVDPQGGTGPGGNGPGGADSGGTSSAGEGSGDTGGGGNSGSNAGGEADQTPLYQRDPGGCACRLPAPARGHDHAAFGALVVLALVTRRRRRAA